MRKTLAAVVVASTLLAASQAFASDPPPPPPPPPDSSGDSSSSSSGTSLTHQPGGLFDTASGKQRPMLLSVFAGLPYAYYGYGFGFGIGARFYLPLVQDGFIPQINDEFDRVMRQAEETPARILVADDDPNIADLVRSHPDRLIELTWIQTAGAKLCDVLSIRVKDNDALIPGIGNEDVSLWPCADTEIPFIT